MSRIISFIKGRKSKFEEWTPRIFPEYVTKLTELVEYSFIFQETTSITHLDLSLSEFSSFKTNLEMKSDQKNVILTEEAARKHFAPDRKILYDYHLDVSKEFELSLRNTSNKEFKRIYSETILINRILLIRTDIDYRFDLLLLQYFKTITDKVKFIHSVCKMPKYKPYYYNLTTMFIRNNGLITLHSKSADSNVVVDFLTTMQLSRQYFVALNNDVFEFVLYKTNQARFNLWTIPGYVTIDFCIYHLRLQNAQTLLKYHNDSRFCNAAYSNLKYKASRFGLLKSGADCPVQQGLMSKERHLRILQIFHVYDISLQNHDEELKVMQMLWRSIPDPFITMYDLTSVFYRHLNPEFIDKICEFIENMQDEVISEKVIHQPRKLKHYCRITIRRILSKNFQLLSGIDELQAPKWLSKLILPIGELSLPPSIITYLRLEE